MEYQSRSNTMVVKCVETMEFLAVAFDFEKENFL